VTTCVPGAVGALKDALKFPMLFTVALAAGLLFTLMVTLASGRKLAPDTCTSWPGA